MNYKAIEASSTHMLSARVNEMIKDGWSPAGGISVCHSKSGVDEHFVLAQAMVRDEAHQVTYVDKPTSIVAFDFMLKNDKEHYRCIPWRTSFDKEGYCSVRELSGYVCYRGHVFIVSHHNETATIHISGDSSVDVVKIK